jgi:hypothetical protein
LRRIRSTHLAVLVGRRGLLLGLAALDLRQQAVERIDQFADFVVAQLGGAARKHAVLHRVARDVGHGCERTRHDRLQPGRHGPRDGQREQDQHQREAL